MRRKTICSALAVAAVGAAWGAGAASAQTAGVQGLAPVQVSGATDQGATSVGSMAVTIALQPRDRAGLQALLAAERAGTHGPISAAQYRASFAPAASTVGAVESWAKSNGLTVSSVSDDNQLIRLTGSSSAVGKAFGVTFDRFATPNGTSFRSPTSTATLPASFAGDTAAVLGLSDLGRASLPLKHPTTSATPGLNFPASYSPKDFWSLYDAPSSATGSGQALAVIAEGDMTVPQKDYSQFWSTYLPGMTPPAFNVIKVNGASSDTSGNDEWDLDTQYSTGFAPGVSSVNVYDGPSLADADILATVQKWVSDDAEKQGSFSAGECELLAYVSGFSASLDNTLARAAAQGQTLFTSSGDTGSFCPAIVGVNGVPAGLPNVNYPASSPSAIGVGGTTVLGPGNEIAWYAGGGGSSFLEPTPAYQTNAGGSFLGVERGVPDVALDADPNSGYNVIVAGQPTVIGGTSASAPSWQGIWARVQGADGAKGFAGSPLYSVGGSAFRDITIGSNGLYPATPGWDYVTGRGTPDIAKLISGL